jgi:hypothetical protein
MALIVFYTEINQTLKRVSVIMASKIIKRNKKKNKKKANSKLPMFCAVRQVAICTYKHCAVYILPG